MRTRMIRCVTKASGENSGDFITKFNDDITLNPNAKIGLINSTLTFNENYINIGPAYNNIRCNSGELGSERSFWASTTNLSLSYDKFIKLLENRINDSLENSNIRGSKYFITYDESSKEVIMNIVRRKATEPNLFLATSRRFLVNGDSAPYQKTIGSESNNSAYLISDNQLMTSYARVVFSISAVGQGFFGLTRENIRGRRYISQDDIPFSVRIDSSGDYQIRYYDLDDNTFKSFDPQIIASPNDNIIFEYRGGVLHFIHEDATGQTIMFSCPLYEGRNEDPVNNRQPYSIACVFTDNILVLDSIDFHEEPFTSFSDPSPSPPTGRNFVLKLPLNYRQYFNVGTITTDSSGNNIIRFDWSNVGNQSDVYISEIATYKRNRPLSIMIETPNLPLECYDGLESIKGLRNILSVVPNQFNDEDNLVYQTNFPIMLSLNNTFPITLRDIHLIITDLDNNVINLRNGATVALLIEDKVESYD